MNIYLKNDTLTPPLFLREREAAAYAAAGEGDSIRRFIFGKTRRQRQRGVALVGAIFVVVILAMLGIYMVTLSGVEQATTSQAVVAARVYYGAKAGLEWGIHQAIGPTLSPCTSIYPAATTTPLASLTGFNNIAVTVTCSCTFTLTNCNSAVNSVYYLTSTAEYGTYGNADYAKREIEATVTGIP